jgi:hypothetical protein
VLGSTVSALLRLERLIDERDLRSVYMNPCLVAEVTPSAASGERCWSDRGVIVYMTCIMRDGVVRIVNWEPFKGMCDHRRSSTSFRRIDCINHGFASINHNIPHP